MAGFPKPCIECGRLSLGDSRCEEHRLERIRLREAMREKRKYKSKPKREHYGGDYAKRAKAVRENAIYCHLCGDGARYNDPWTADHVIAGNPLSPLAPAHRSCNSSRQRKPLDELDNLKKPDDTL